MEKARKMERRDKQMTLIVDLPIKNGDFPWDLMGFIRIYDGIPSGKRLHSYWKSPCYENG